MTPKTAEDKSMSVRLMVSGKRVEAKVITKNTTANAYNL